MAMRQRTKIILGLFLVPIGLIAGLFVWNQFGPSIELANQVKGGMTLEECEKVLGPSSRVEEYKYEKQILEWDLKDGTAKLHLDRRNGRVIVENVEATPGAGTVTSGPSIQDAYKLPRSTRDEAVQAIGPPSREGEWDQYTLRRIGWEFRDGFVFVSFNRSGRAMDAKASPVSQWERIWWRSKMAIGKVLK